MKVVVILLSFLLISCATVLSKRSYNVTISSQSNRDSAEINNNRYSLPAIVKVKRSSEDLGIKLISDETILNFNIKPSPTPTFLFGNLFWVTASPAAYLIDLTNQKRFYFGKNIFLSKYDSNRTIIPAPLGSIKSYFAKRYPRKAGDIILTLSLPHANSFYLKPENEIPKSNTGFWGISGGLEYYYKANKYLSFNANAVSDFFVPVPAAVDIQGKYELMTSVYLGLTINKMVHRFSYGYGINYSKNSWKYEDRYGAPAIITESIIKSSQSIGITINGYHQISKSFFVGLIYRPNLLRTAPALEFNYEHVISLDFMWKIKLTK
jgi:hypothetical protein